MGAGPISADFAIALAAIAAGEPLRTASPEPDGPYLRVLGEVEALLGCGSLLDWEMQPDRTAEQVNALLRTGEVAGGRMPPLSPDPPNLVV